MDKKINLCDSCTFHVATCGSKPKFGTGKGNDNVYDCDTFRFKILQSIQSEKTDNIKVVESSNKDKFESLTQDLMNQGYKISSTSCGFVNSEKYDFCDSYQAILIKDNE